MDSSQLRSLLREYTDKEKELLLNPDLASNTDNHPSIITEAIFRNEEHIKIIKHPRIGKTREHRHQYIEMIYVFSGQCTQRIHAQDVVMHEGDICLLDTNVTHSILPVGENDIIINILMRKRYFNESLLGRLSGNDLLSSFLINSVYQSKVEHNYILSRHGKNSKVHQWVTELLCEYYDKSLCSDEIIDCYIILIFSEILRAYRSADSHSGLQRNKGVNISDILAFMEDHATDASLTAAAAHFNLHPNYLSTLLKTQTGKTFLSHMQDMKMKKACLLLKNTDLSIEAVIKEAGYENQTFFYKKFKARFSLTPLEYRNAPFPVKHYL
ncbi:AraC family transcriptional regulator [Paenibacillus sp. N4]|uniref:AraC family transcriptional regulator n=1 Tax=Paenibacillus vietnamensis TaxID=2590547 RepID=UPI001CD0548D|nr:AraC family transcriptional regulator [Paenibacillus vietnamensis]MCA0757838.1 AraC family transcriptional regulator [Paenibacillus vietnamensis]